MTTNSSDFVLDDGLDDDEDVLAYHSSNLTSQHLIEEEQNPASSTISNPSETNPPTNQSNIGNTNTPQPTTSSSANTPPAVIIDGLPLGSSRKDLNTFLSSDTVSNITSVQLRRLEDHGLLRVRVEFATEDSTQAALALDGGQLHPNGPHLSVKRATPERWDASGGSQAAKRPSARTGPSTLDSVRASFWGAFGAARGFAEKLEDSAKKLGEQLEDRLHVSEKVTQAKSSVEQFDRDYRVQQRFGEAVENGKRTAEGIDRAYGISDGVGRVSESVGNAAKIVAREVDENLRVSDKARNVTNAALKNETLAPVARTVVGGIGEQQVSGKNYQPVSGAAGKEGNEAVVDGE